MDSITRKCSFCEQYKSINDFYRNKSNKDGYASMCKDCCKNSSKKWYGNNKEVHRERVYNWRTNNPEKTKEIDKRYRENNPDKLRIKYEKRRKDNPIQALLYKWTRRARKKNVGGVITKKEWEDLKSCHSYKCLCCGKYEPEIKLSLDHVIPLALGGSNVIENAQPLCIKCNNIKNAKTIDYRK